MISKEKNRKKIFLEKHNCIGDDENLSDERQHWM